MEETMKHRKVPTDACVIPEVRVTAQYDDELRKLLKDTLATMGQVQPIIVAKDGDKFIVVDGAHRLQEAREAGLHIIDAVIIEGDAVDALLHNLVLNKVRGKTKASELVAVIHELYTQHDLGIEDIVKRTGFSQEYIEKLINVSLASPSVLEELDAEVIGVSHAYEISRLPTWRAQDEVVAKYKVWKWNVKDLRDQISAILEMVPEPDAVLVERPTAAPARYTCEVCRLEGDLKHLRPIVICPECYGVVYSEASRRKALLETKPETQT